jgi:prophage regulatory protein
MSEPFMRILRVDEVLERRGDSQTQLYKDVAERKFPAPVKIGVRSIGWLEHEVDDWIANRPRAEPGETGAGGNAAVLAAAKRGKVRAPKTAAAAMSETTTATTAATTTKRSKAERRVAV